ncbi:Alpha/Beta hydrolase protein, partial [Cladorrhinum sp. PSN259]
PTPLILIHDGGGTIFAYYCLNPLHPRREVYAIANPRYHSLPPADFPSSLPQWEGGIPQMAAHYLSLIKSLYPTRGTKILLGGWSMGGLISLQIAKLIADEGERYFDVVGIVMIDSICPIVMEEDSRRFKRVVQHAVQWGTNTREDTKLKVMRCFDEAVKMVGSWDMPEWAEGERVPPAILLKAKESVPLPESEKKEGAVSRVDIHRRDELLGWDLYRKGFVSKVVEIPGHHFNIFAPEVEGNLDFVSTEIGRACVDLERMWDCERKGGW